jgi:prepilin-type processing-associated H-X9-DG protein
MSESQIKCLHCGHLIASRAAPGQLLQCPSCRNVFPVPRGASETQQAPRAERPAASLHRTAYPAPGDRDRIVRRFPNRPATFGLLFAILFFVILAGHFAASAFGVKLTGDLEIFIMLVTLVCLLLALILGIVGFVRTRNPRRKGRVTSITALVFSGVAIVYIVLTIPAALARSNEMANRITCAAHLKQIGMCMQIYSNENKGQYPPGPEALLLTQDITDEVFICPSSNDKISSDMTLEKRVAKLADGGHDSYVYLGKGKNGTAGGKVVLAYEVMSHHIVGFNALFGDGHVEFIGPPIAQKVQAELQAGQNPPPSYR